MRIDKDRVFILRAEKELQIKDIAKKCEVTPQAISNSINADKVSAMMAGKIAKALGVDVEEILTK